MKASEKSAEWIANAMKATGINQAELARRAGLTSGRISQILNGKRSTINVATLFRLIEACGLEITELRAKKKAA